MSGAATRNGPWTVNERRIVYENPWISVAHCDVTRPDGAPGVYGVVHFCNVAVGVLPIDREGSTMLVGQHRFPHDAYSWELPEGGAPHGEAPEAAARRELLEETGYRAGSMTPLCEFDLSNSVTDEKGVCFIAWDLTLGAAEPEPDEILAHRRVSFAELHKMALDGEIRDSLTLLMVFSAAAAARAGRLPAEVAALVLKGL
jgi:8-oxo-dGTP pyrophosphatase MutT (NUDIX family)